MSEELTNMTDAQKEAVTNLFTRKLEQEDSNKLIMDGIGAEFKAVAKELGIKVAELSRSYTKHKARINDPLKEEKSDEILLHCYPNSYDK